MVLKENKTKILILILIILSLLTIVSAIRFSIVKNKKQNASNLSSSTIPQQIKWVTYTNPVYGYTFDYPSGLEIRNKSQNSIMVDSRVVLDWIEGMKQKDDKNYYPFVSITVYDSFSQINSNYSSLAKFVEKNNQEVQAVTIDNNKGYLYLFNEPSKHKTIYLQKGDLIYQIDFNMFAKESEIQQKMINSLKFK